MTIIDHESDIRVRTERLELVAADMRHVQAERTGRAALAALLGAEVPVAWPPPLNDEKTFEAVAALLAKNGDRPGWAYWYFVLRNGPANRSVAVGVGGCGAPSSDGTAELGYSLLEEFQGYGYATEAVRGLIDWAFGHEEVVRMTAQTLPDLAPSIRVLDRTGFSFVGEGSEPGVIRYELLRRGPAHDREPPR